MGTKFQVCYRGKLCTLYMEYTMEGAIQCPKCGAKHYPLVIEKVAEAYDEDGVNLTPKKIESIKRRLEKLSRNGEDCSCNGGMPLFTSVVEIY